MKPELSNEWVPEYLGGEPERPSTSRTVMWTHTPCGWTWAGPTERGGFTPDEILRDMSRHECPRARVVSNVAALQPRPAVEHIG